MIIDRLLDLTPLKRQRDFRFLYTGQFISFFGSMITYVALPYQVFHITKSSFAVGMIGMAQLIPLLLLGMIGGALADSVDRRKLLLRSEFAQAACCLILVWNSLLAEPYLWLIFVLAACLAGLNGIHRPALEALTPRLVSRNEIPAVARLSSLRSNVGMIGGPAVGGLLIAHLGLSTTFAADVITYVVSLISISMIRSLPKPEGAEPISLKAMKEGLRYAKSRQDLMGTYIVDIVAMVFGMPMALFPAIADEMGGASYLGWLYSAPSVGALVATLTSGWTKQITRHGKAIILAATVWGIAIVLFGMIKNIWVALFFLGVAGGADMISGIFRSIIWNTTIPDRLRGRMAGIEMISYSSGPLIGNAESGLAASIGGTQFSVVSGGVLCVLGVLASAYWLPQFWRYEADNSEPLIKSEAQ